MRKFCKGEEGGDFIGDVMFFFSQPTPGTALN